MISEFFFSYIGCLFEPCLPYYSRREGRRIHDFLSVFSRRETVWDQTLYKYLSYSPWGIERDLLPVDRGLLDLERPEERAHVWEGERDLKMDHDTWTHIWLVHTKLKQLSCLRDICLYFLVSKLNCLVVCPWVRLFQFCLYISFVYKNLTETQRTSPRTWNKVTNCIFSNDNLTLSILFVCDVLLRRYFKSI